MTRLFADACYWIALCHRRDELHETADAAREQLSNAEVVTTDEVLAEVLGFFSGKGSYLRMLAVQIVEGVRNDSRVRVVEQSRASFDGGLALYKGRSDRQYSLVDCVSFELMRQMKIKNALTNDHHFEQEQFVAILRKSGA